MKTIPFLLVEDDVKRIEKLQRWLPEWARFVKITSGGRAASILKLTSLNLPEHKRDKYAGIMLDYNLEKQAITSDEELITGKKVCHLIIQYVPRDVPILIHSMNFTAGVMMMKILESSGFYVKYIPFEEINSIKFNEWLEEAKALWDENLEV